jgi:DNA (cytosine-5)-methyltransferase 1
MPAKRAANGHIAGLSWVSQKERPRACNGKTRKLALVDLFCSCGGMSLGVWEAARLRQRQLDIRLAIDLAPEPLAVYRANLLHDENRVRQADIRTLFDGNKGQPPTPVERHLKEFAKKIDAIVAGPPCQGHSDLNNTTRRKDPRNGLYVRVARAAEVLQPRVVIIENVPQVLHDRGHSVARTANWLRDIGYVVSHDVVRLGSFGVPQLRNRHILAAVLGADFDLSELDDVRRAVPSAGTFLAGLERETKSPGLFYLSGKMNPTNKARVDFLFNHSLHDLPNSERPKCHREKSHTYLSMYGRMHWDRPAPTLTSGFGSMGQGRFVHPTERRLLTPHEAARLQGFPDFFDFSQAKTMSGLREMIANAVPPQFTATLVVKLIDKGVL